MDLLHELWSIVNQLIMNSIYSCITYTTIVLLYEIFNIVHVWKVPKAILFGDPNATHLWIRTDGRLGSPTMSMLSPVTWSTTFDLTHLFTITIVTIATTSDRIISVITVTDDEIITTAWLDDTGTCVGAVIEARENNNEIEWSCNQDDWVVNSKHYLLCEHRLDTGL